MNLECKEWCIYPTVALTSDVKIVVKKLGPVIKEVTKCDKCIYWLWMIGELKVFWNLAYRESDTSWTLQVKDWSVLVPWVRILLDFCVIIFDDTRTMLLDQAEHRWTARTSIKPDQNWIFAWWTLGFNEYIVQFSRWWLCPKIATICLWREFAICSWQVINLICYLCSISYRASCS